MKKLLFFILIFTSIRVSAQMYQEQGDKYPIIADENKYIVSGFIAFNGLGDETIFSNALLWAIDNISPKMRENLNNINVKEKSFEAAITIASIAGSGVNNTYHCKAIFRVANEKLVYHISTITLESSGLLNSKLIPFESFNPQKKENHKIAMEDFTASESLMLNKLFDFILTNKIPTITHWEEIGKQKAIKGMNETECKLAFGKPQDIQDNGTEIQWMYTSSFYLFFKNNLLDTIIK